MLFRSGLDQLTVMVVIVAGEPLVLVNQKLTVLQWVADTVSELATNVSDPVPVTGEYHRSFPSRIVVVPVEPGVTAITRESVSEIGP